MIKKTNDITSIYPHCKKHITKNRAVVYFIDGSYIYTHDKLKNEWHLTWILTEDGTTEL